MSFYPLTGHLAASSELMEQGFDLALREVNDAQLSSAIFKFIIEDDMSTPEGAAAAFNKLIHEDGVSVILGPATSSATREAFPIAQENQVVAISPTSGARGLSAIGDFVFRIPLATNIVVIQGVEATHAKLGYQRVATLYEETDLFSTDRDTTLQEVFTAKDIEVAHHGSLPERRYRLLCTIDSDTGIASGCYLCLSVAPRKTGDPDASACTRHIGSYCYEFPNQC